MHRPNGQTMADGTRGRLSGRVARSILNWKWDFSSARATRSGSPIPVNQAAEHIFGLALVNNSSTRDVQRWECVPLGPFLAKSFCTSLSPWIVTLDALEPFRTAGPAQEPEPLAYLRRPAGGGFDVRLEVSLTRGGLRERRGFAARICDPCTGTSASKWPITRRTAAIYARAICWRPARSAAPSPIRWAACSN